MANPERLGFEYPPLPPTAADYLNSLWKAYVDINEMPEWLVMYVSPELFKLYKDQCISNMRFSQTPDLYQAEPRLALRNARVKQDPDLQGHKVRFLEDEYAFRR